VSVGGGGTFSYDLNGNMLSDGVYTYEWDAANRLTAVNEPGGLRSEFKYDGQGRRVCITEKNGGTVTGVKNLIWNGMTIAEARDQTNTLTKRYFPEGVQVGGSNYYYTRDHLGSIRELTDTNGVLKAEYQYDPYGVGTQTSGTLSADFGYTGFYYHQPSALDLAPYREYRPGMARWISRDTLKNAERTQGADLYEYTRNSPITLADPLGLASELLGSAPNIRIDTDGAPEMPEGAPHGDPDWNPDTALPGDNADTDIYAVKPEGGAGKKGDCVVIMANNSFVVGHIGDVGKSERGWGEVSYAAVEALNIPIHDWTFNSAGILVGPVTLPSTKQYPVQIYRCPCNKK
jgi:RHS repeat-associated protein